MVPDHMRHSAALDEEQKMHYVTYLCTLHLKKEKFSLVARSRGRWKYMANSPKLESMPTLSRSATLLAETTISKWRVMANIRQLLQLPTGGTTAFGILDTPFITCL